MPINRLLLLRLCAFVILLFLLSGCFFKKACPVNERKFNKATKIK